MAGWVWRTQSRRVLPLSAPALEARSYETESRDWGEQVSTGTGRPNADVVGMWVTADGCIRQELRADVVASARSSFIVAADGGCTAA